MKIYEVRSLYETEETKKLFRDFFASKKKAYRNAVEGSYEGYRCSVTERKFSNALDLCLFLGELSPIEPQKTIIVRDNSNDYKSAAYDEIVAMLVPDIKDEPANEIQRKLMLRLSDIVDQFNNSRR